MSVYEDDDYDPMDSGVERGAPYHPNPHTSYLCPYCNIPACLKDVNVVIDSWTNVCHLTCLEKAIGKYPHSFGYSQPKPEGNRRGDRT